MMEAIKTIYNTAVELAILANSDDTSLPYEKFVNAVYRDAAKFSAVLSDEELIESIRYVEAAEIRRVRIVGKSEDGKCILVTDPAVPMAEEEDEVAAKLSEAVEAALNEEPEAESGSEGDEPEGTPAESESEVENASEGENKSSEVEAIEFVREGILGADVAETLSKCKGKVCDVYIGGDKHYSLNDLYCKKFAGKVVKIEVVNWAL